MKMPLKRILSNNIFMLKFALRYTPGYLFHICIFSIYSAVEVFFEFTFCSKYLIDLIQYQGSFMDALRYLIFVTVIIVIKLIWGPILDHSVKPRAKEILHKHMQKDLFQNAVSLDLSCYDDPKFYNEYVWSVSEANSRIDAIIDDLSRLCGSFATILSMGVFFLSYNKLGLVFTVISLCITLIANSAIGKLKFQFDTEFKPIERKRNYFNRVFYLSDYAKEIRLNPISERLQEQFQEENTKIYPLVKKYGRKQTLLGFLADEIANSLLLDVFYLTYLIYQTVVKQVLSYGSMISLFHASNNLKNNLKNLSVLLPKFQEHSFYVEKIRCFLAYQPTITAPSDPSPLPEEFHELSFRNVSFGYGTDAETLKNLTFDIKQGEKIAFVGYNGAGKTTLTKLIMRLYDTTQGEILLNGVNVKNYSVRNYRAFFGSVFQDYRLYAASVAENVLMNTVTNNDTEVITRALQQGGFTDRLSNMTDGLSTPLTREFHEKGTNLSGGEAQKIAISRVFATPYNFIILDEPSSALDPISEYHLNESMLKASINKTVIFISHRLSSTRMADKIYMLEKGQIIEQGSHNELMAMDGKYAQMFRIQAEKYQNCY